MSPKYLCVSFLIRTNVDFKTFPLKSLRRLDSILVARKSIRPDVLLQYPNISWVNGDFLSILYTRKKNTIILCIQRRTLLP